MSKKIEIQNLPVVADCNGCGVCCMHMGYPAFMEPVASSFDRPYWEAMPTDLRDDLLRAMADYQPPAKGELDGPCIWLDLQTRQCKQHRYRPRVCRDFEIGSRECLDWRRVYQDRIQKT